MKIVICSSCTVYTVLFWIIFTTNVGRIGAYFVYFHGYLKKMFTHEKTIYKNYKMRELKQINIKNRTYYFYIDQINLKDTGLLKVDKNDYKEIDIYYIGYTTFKQITNCNNIISVNPLYLMINEMTGHFEEKNENKYLLLDDVDANEEVSKKFKEVWEGAEIINGSRKVECGKDFLKNRFKSNDDLPLNKPIKLGLLAITIRCVFSEGVKFYPQLFLENALYES